MGCGKVFKSVAKVVTAPVKAVSKVLPVIETVALTMAGVPAPIASAAVSAANGGNVGDIIKAGIGGAVGQAVGGQVGSAASSAGYSPTVTSILASAAGQGSSALIQTGDIGKALQAAGMGGLTTGIVKSTGIDTALKNVGQSITGLGTGTGTTSFYGGDTGLPVGTSVPTSPYGTTDIVSATSPYGTTSYQTLPSMSYSPGLFEKGTKYVGEQVSGSGQGIVGSMLSQALNLGSQPTSTTAPTSGTITTTGQAGTTPGTQALGQALRVDPGAVFGKGDESPPQNVWNLASLRVKDETGS